jgi:hypothetical protein
MNSRRRRAGKVEITMGYVAPGVPAAYMCHIWKQAEISSSRALDRECVSHARFVWLVQLSRKNPTLASSAASLAIVWTFLVHSGRKYVARNAMCLTGVRPAPARDHFGD